MVQDLSYNKLSSIYFGLVGRFPQLQQRAIALFAFCWRSHPVTLPAVETGTIN
ncbi:MULTISPECIES: hypothetical protein [unclassified Microcoleus]|uniref:hypothetical protein n=1 Tax=unclassified Microcoleus TaxID=2642155 RepID=UPI0025ED613D|nr:MULTISPECIES: hypothetical protein [unclassified Microcoleus]